VNAILERSCYDCHSNKTVWPWYSYVAPVSWLIANDVHGGRRHVNFTDWNSMDARRQDRALRNTTDEVEQGDMPLWYYLPLHRSARLSVDDKAILKAWVESVPQVAPGPAGGGRDR
jgi:hypothetical protein